MFSTQAVRGAHSAPRALWVFAIAAVLLGLFGCAQSGSTIKPIEPAQGGKRFTSYEFKEGEHVRDLSDETRRALRDSIYNIMISEYNKDEKNRVAAGQTDIRKMTVTYRVTGYDAGNTWLRGFIGWSGLGKSVLKAEAVYSDGDKVLARVEVQSVVAFNDLLESLDAQHSNHLWGEVWQYFSDNFNKPWDKVKQQ
jgi:hypothetical protein